VPAKSGGLVPYTGNQPFLLRVQSANAAGERRNQHTAIAFERCSIGRNIVIGKDLARISVRSARASDATSASQAQVISSSAMRRGRLPVMASKLPCAALDLVQKTQRAQQFFSFGNRTKASIITS
jgi:hypothetical protein